MVYISLKNICKILCINKFFYVFMRNSKRITNLVLNFVYLKLFVINNKIFKINICSAFFSIIFFIEFFNSFQPQLLRILLLIKIIFEMDLLA